MLQRIGLGGPGLRECVVSTSPGCSPKRAQESPVSLIGKLYDDVQRTEVWVGEVTIVVPTKFCQIY